MTAVNEVGLVEAAGLVRDGEVSAGELLTACLGRVAARETDVRAWEHLAEEAARDEAARRDTEPAGDRPLHGVPVGIKDIVDVAGMPTGCGSPVRAGQVAARDAWCVRRLRAAGAVIVGKTVTTEFAYFNPGRTRNPHDLDRTPGGSSSGSAAAVADFMVGAALGSQTAGSTVRPASFCGIAGFVPTYGRVPLDGVQPLSPVLDRLGLLTRTVDDLRPLYQAFVDDAAPPQPRPPQRVLVADGTALTRVHPGMRDAVERVAAAVTDSGVPVEPLGADDLQRRCAEALRVIMAYDAARALGELAEENRDQVSEELLTLLDDGAATLDSAYLAALDTVASSRRELAAALADGAVVLAPAAPGPAPAGLGSTGDSVLNRPWHVLGLPEAALPAGTADGVPVGVQLVGALGADDRLLDVTAWTAELLT